MKRKEVCPVTSSDISRFRFDASLIPADNIVNMSEAFAVSDMTDDELFDPDPEIVQRLIKNIPDLCIWKEALFSSKYGFDTPIQIQHIIEILETMIQSYENETKAVRMSGIAGAFLTEMLCNGQRHIDLRQSEGTLAGILNIIAISHINTRLASSSSGYLRKLASLFFDLDTRNTSLEKASFAERICQRVRRKIPYLQIALLEMIDESKTNIGAEVEQRRVGIVEGNVTDREAAEFLVELATYDQGCCFSRVFGKFPRRLCTAEFLFGSKFIPVGEYLFSPGEIAFARNYKLRTMITGREKQPGYAIISTFRALDLKNVPEKILAAKYPVAMLEIINTMCSGYGGSPSTRKVDVPIINESLTVKSVSEISLAEYMLLCSSHGRKEVLARPHLWEWAVRKVLFRSRESGKKECVVSLEGMREFLQIFSKEDQEIIQSIFTDKEVREIVSGDKFPGKLLDLQKIFASHRFNTVADLPNIWLGGRKNPKLLKNVYYRKIPAIQNLFCKGIVWEELLFRMENDRKGFADFLCMEFLKMCFDPGKRQNGSALSPREPIPEKFLLHKFRIGEYAGESIFDFLLSECLFPTNPEILFQKLPDKIAKKTGGYRFIDPFLMKLTPEWRSIKYSHPVIASAMPFVIFEAILNIIGDSRFVTPHKQDHFAAKRGELVGLFVNTIDDSNLQPGRWDDCLLKGNKYSILHQYQWISTGSRWKILLARKLGKMAKLDPQKSTPESSVILRSFLNALRFYTSDLFVEEKGNNFNSGSVHLCGVSEVQDKYGSRSLEKVKCKFYIEASHSGYEATLDANKDIVAAKTEVKENLTRFAKWVKTIADGTTGTAGLKSA